MFLNRSMGRCSRWVLPTPVSRFQGEHTPRRVLRQIRFVEWTDLARKYRKGFPKSLDGAPLLLPTASAVLRRDVGNWLESEGVTPLIRGEFDDSALIKVVGQSGAGLFFAPSILDREVKNQYGVERVGEVGDIRERFYAISVERRFKNPAVIALSERAKTVLLRD